MKRPQLLRVTTPFLILDINGPYEPSRGTYGPTNFAPARLNVASSRGPIEVIWSDGAGHTTQWSLGEFGPPFFEDTSYRIRARSLIPGCIPVPLHRDPHLFQEIDEFPEDGMCAGPINFRRQVGFSTLEFRVGDETFRLTVEVFTVKLDYASDYAALLASVASTTRGLGLEYLRATFHAGSVEEAHAPANLEWLVLLRNEINTLDQSVRYINDHPARALVQRPERVRLDRAKRVDSSLRRAVLRQLGTPPTVHVEGIGEVRTTLPAFRNAETLDTSEHRWLRLNLSLVVNHLSDLHRSISAEMQRAQRTYSRVPERLLAEEREVAQFIGTIEALLSLGVFNAVEGTPPAGFSSLALISGIGYGDAYASVRLLQMGLSLKTGLTEFSVSDVHELYEVWCFLEIVRLVSRLFSDVDVAGLVKLDQTGLRVQLRRGHGSAVTFQDRVRDRLVTVRYNPSFAGLTGNQRPDIVVNVRQSGWPDLVIVLDAKYRLDASKEYRRRFKTVGPPQVAVDAIHRYRDAIVHDSVEHGLERPVVRGAVLFPLSDLDSDNYQRSPLFRALDILGVGALPFLPRNVALVLDWVTNILSLPQEQLADPGPPYAGIAEKQRRELLVAARNRHGKSGSVQTNVREFATGTEPSITARREPTGTIRLIEDSDPSVASERFRTLLPLYSLRAAAGKFGSGKTVEPEAWVDAGSIGRLNEAMFVAQIEGHSMEPRLHDGDYAVFRSRPEGSRDGKIVLVQYRDPADPDTGGTYVVKRYRSKKTQKLGESWHHTSIVLESLNPQNESIILDGDDSDNMMVVAEFVTVLGGE